MAWRYNTDNQRVIRAAFLNAVFFGASWTYIGLGIKNAPSQIRRAAYVVVPYAAMLFAIGYSIEIRYWITMLPILIPLLLNGLLRPEAQVSQKMIRTDTAR